MNNKAFSNLILSVVLLAGTLACAGQTTQTATARQSLQFIVIGDWGMQGDATQVKIAQQMEQVAATHTIDFIVTTGDNFYPFGVKSVDDPAWQKNYEAVYALPHLKDIPWYVTLGNHDYFGEFQAEIDYAKKNPRWILPANYHTRDFTLNDKLLARLLFVDSNPYLKEYLARPDLYHHVDKQDTAAQTAWMEKTLNDDKPVWKLIFAHHPLYSSGEHGDTVELIQAWTGFFKQYHVNAYFAGHDHHLEHINPEDGTHYFISGGGGALTRHVGQGPHSLFSVQSHGFTHVTLDAACMWVRFIDAEGAELYQTAIAATPETSCAPTVH
ncbi:MAG: acid phosphatase [Gammaproteobacteria bacterium]|nr:acid phosphatase [Gammaproteobacteria bacterium]